MVEHLFNRTEKRGNVLHLKRQVITVSYTRCEPQCAGLCAYVGLIQGQSKSGMDF